MKKIPRGALRTVTGARAIYPSGFLFSRPILIRGGNILPYLLHSSSVDHRVDHATNESAYGEADEEHRYRSE